MCALPALVACSHGTSSEAGRTAVAALVAAVADRLPQTRIVPAFVDVQQPTPGEVLRELGGPAVVVPLLLSAGYHVYVDLTDAVQGHPAARLAAALGPDERLVEVLADRYSSTGSEGLNDAVVLACAGSSDVRAVHDCAQMAGLLSQRLGRPVTPAFLSAAHPRLDAAVHHARAGGASRVVALTYLLAPGFFAESAAAAGADVTTAPLLTPDERPDPRVVELVVDRYRAAAGQS